MAAPLSMELRERICKAYDQGGVSQAQVAERFMVSPRTVERLLARRRDTGSIAPGQSPGRPRKLSEEECQKLRQAVEAKPDATLKELREECEINGSLTLIDNELKRQNLTRKKKSLAAEQRQRSDVVKRRRNWPRAAQRFGAERLVFLDESSVDTQLVRTHARSLKGERIVDTIPGNRKKLSVISAVRAEGIFATQALEGSFDGEAFWLWVKHFLAPQLGRDDVVVMDNLQVHKDERALAEIRRAGAKFRFLPPYSPEMNPIEELWSKFKWLIRTDRPRTTAEMNRAIGRAVETITEDDIAAWFNHAYPSIIS